MYLLAGALLGLSSPAQAQLGAIASIYSDYRFRGVSLSDGRPVAVLDLSYDLPCGAYAAFSTRFVAPRDEGPRLLGVAANVGYAARIRPSLSADVGVVHSSYSRYSGLGADRSYSEFYAGLTGKRIGIRISISPDYLGSVHWSAYAELDGHIDLSRLTLVEGAAGVLAPLAGGYRTNGRVRADARIGVSHRLGPVTLHAAVTAGSRSYGFATRAHNRTALVIGISTSL